jgi:DNA-binding CsgD family transcriptional regulator
MEKVSMKVMRITAEEIVKRLFYVGLINSESIKEAEMSVTTTLNAINNYVEELEDENKTKAVDQ